jgi:hypothetical protein
LAKDPQAATAAARPPDDDRAFSAFIMMGALPLVDALITRTASVPCEPIVDDGRWMSTIMQVQLT